MAEEADADRVPSRVLRLPRFLVPEAVGAGDVVKRITTAVGVRPCGGCAQRADQMNQWLRLEPRR